MTEIEGKMFLVEIDGKEKFVSFQFELLPNDMKYLAFLGGELSISASYFSPFADINKKDIANTQENFGSKPQDKWHPWKYSQRLRVAAAVKEKKEEVSKTTLKPATKREKITSFISQKKSRQEFLPLVGKFIDRAKTYFGVPYHKKYKEPDAPEAPLYLDCCGLVRQVMRDLADDFGFPIARWNQAYQFDILPEAIP